ncbi:MEAB protein [Coccidioides immitis RMSCC 2394]|uniref:MEAB protein n=1 Tax=Coccidioides immitis RMSCC 2394 TaxID=404692 RepID=A0A0J6YLL8_COCIT|nr:MEAB protein [Coccidioides immitis RMSCC 2394]
MGLKMWTILRKQAQVAFRERRTEYIKQLEATIKLNEETLRTLQQSHRSAADECLMLRYKNSLLERILLEKGIDVQGELRLKSGSPSLPPARLPPHQPHRPSPLSQPMFNRQPTHQQSVGIAQRSAQVGVSQHEGAYNVHSSQTQQPTPSSHVSPSPAASVSSGYTLHGGMSPAGVEIHAQSQSHKSQFPRAPVLPQPGGFGQEYGAQAMSHDQQEPEESTTTPNTFAHEFSTTRGTQRGSHSELHSHVGDTDGFGAATSFADHFDPMLDTDPFGLSASMHFQTPFSYAQSNVR